MNINSLKNIECQCEYGLVKPSECEYCRYIFSEYYNKAKGIFIYPSCAHCGNGGGDCPEIIKRGYRCNSCSSEMEIVYICRNCSYEECPKNEN